MPESFERGDVAPVALYRMGHTDDSNEFMFHDSWFLPGCFVFDLPSTATRKHARHRFALRFARRNGDLTRICPSGVFTHNWTLVLLAFPHAPLTKLNVR